MPSVNSKYARNPDHNRFHLHALPYACPSPSGSASSSLSSILENLKAGDPSASVLDGLLKELQFHNETNTVTYTYCNILRWWTQKPWFQYSRNTYRNGSVIVAPTGFKNIQYNPLQCPHSQIFYREVKDTAMKLAQSPTIKMAPWSARSIRAFIMVTTRTKTLTTDRDSSDDVASLLMSSSQNSSMSSIVALACVLIITKNRPYLFEMAELEHLSCTVHVPDLHIVDQDMVTTMLTDGADHGVRARANYNNFFDTNTDYAVHMLNSTVGLTEEGDAHIMSSERRLPQCVQYRGI
ncbi:hypothetical protein C8R44DRAFT_751907 [Mycena epipterygia]|nr:hypothetical protein C8R44DRAFT_751907 [Mycena epipterygia]